jgi:hypothetical protein
MQWCNDMFSCFVLLCLTETYFLKYLAFIILFLLPGITKAQDSCSLEISLLTCSPGEELYSTFGHTAVRVKDSTTGTDQVYNYGTFAFGPDFYPKFIRGKLDYALSVEGFADFMYAYEYDKRSVYEQKLLISCAEKQKLFDALQINAQEGNRYYRYDFLRDNCTTRAGDVIAKNLSSPVNMGQIITPKNPPTYRNLLYIYLDNGAQHWSKFGIDLLLGSKLDKKVTNTEALFLPDNLMKAFEESRVANQRLVAPTVTILNMPSPLRGSSFFTPMVLFSILLVAIAVLSFVRKQGVQKAIAVFDFVFFLVLGLAGCLLLFMWLGTEHVVCRDNLNLMWALPTHLLAAFAVRTNKRWMQYYLLGTIILATILLVGSPFLPQQLNLAFYPIILIVLLRSWLIILKPHHNAEERAAL